MGQLIKLDNLRLEKILKEYQVVLEKSLPECVRINARLLAVELARRTQPFGDDGKIGEAAVERDIRKVVKLPIQLTSQMTSPRLAKSIREKVAAGNWKGVRDTMIASGWAKDFQFLNGSAAIKPVHQSYRNKRGRVKKKDGDIFATDSSTLHNYSEMIKARVGIAKAGWAACAKELKTGKGAGTRGIPTWVTRHLKTRTNGHISDRTNNTKAPTVQLVNTVPWIDTVISNMQRLEALSNIGGRMKKQMQTILKKRQTTVEEAA